jgi:transposase
MENTKISFKGQSIFIGLDVHLKSWKVCILTDEFEHAVHTMPTSAKVLSNYLRSHFPDANYYCVYEAGYSGYWIHEELESYGIKNKIVNPLDVPTKDKEKRVKTDRIDCRKLARSLRNGELETICIRDKEQQQDRSLVRMRYTLVKKQTKCKNQIKGLLAFYGIQIQEEKIQTHWSRNFIEWIEESIKQMGSATLSFETLLDELKKLRELILKVTKQIRVLATTERYREKVKLLQSIPGISVLSAMTILTEIGDIRNFHKLDRLNGFIGLIPGEHSSGERESKKGMIHRGNNILKYVLVECSWIAVRKDPSLILSYKEYIKRHKKTTAIIKIARKMVNRIRYVLINQQEYKLSVVV